MLKARSLRERLKFYANTSVYYLLSYLCWRVVAVGFFVVYAELHRIESVQLINRKRLKIMTNYTNK